MMNEYSQYQERKPLYRSRDGMIFGVCRGLADYLDFNVTALRLILAIVAFFSGIMPFVVVYLIAAIIMKPEPVVPFRHDMDREFYESYTTSRPLAIQRLRQTYEGLDRRIQRIESIVTSKDFDWESRMRD